MAATQRSNASNGTGSSASTVRRKNHRTYVLDTSVLLSDPHALLRFDEHEIVIPVIVITELEAKRHHPDPGSRPAGFRLGDNDSRILAVACNLQAEGHDVTLVSKDLPMRVKASSS